MTLLNPQPLPTLGQLPCTLVDGGLYARRDVAVPEVLIELSLDLQECCLDVN